MKKLQKKDLAAFRSNMLKNQDNICSMCKEKIKSPQDAVLDHCHATGHCRAVAHRTCNIVEGKIINSLRRSGGGIDRVSLMKGLSEYFKEDFSQNPLHPTFLTDIDREIKSAKKKQKMAKTDKTKIKHKDAIKDLKSKQVFFNITSVV